MGAHGVKTVLLSGLVAGTLDICTAITFHSLKNGAFLGERILRYVASGAFGKAAFDGGAEMIVAGLIFHFIIAFSFAILYFLIFPRVSFLQKHQLVGGIGWGLFAWAAMNLVVVPLSKIPLRPFNWGKAFPEMLILICCIGFPISFITHHYYVKKSSYC